MSRSYHVTRKQADKAMAAGDMDPTWQASEKAWVKKAEGRKRVLGRALPSRSKTPNHAIVSAEKKRTTKVRTGGDLSETLDGILASKEKPIQPPVRGQ